MASIPVIIITGFLGSGKTTFLRHLLSLCGEAGVRPALIVNEVGKVDVDGELLSDANAEQVRLVGGCVCCTLQAQLADTIEDVLERRAGDLIIIECSGLSNPIDVLTVLGLPFLLRRVAVSHVVCLLDAPRAQKVLQVAELAKSQLAAADLVVFNKTDLLPPGVDRTVEALVAEIAPGARRRWAAYGDIGREELWRLLTDPAPVRATCACARPYHHGEHARELPASFCTAAFVLPDELDPAAVRQLLSALPENVIRAKGFAHLAGAGWHVLHRVFETGELIPLGGDPPRCGGVLVCIGRQLQPADLAALFSETLGVPV